MTKRVNPHIEKKKRPVEAGGVMFDSIAEACLYFKVSAHALKKYIINRKEIPGHNCVPNFISRENKVNN